MTLQKLRSSYRVAETSDYDECLKLLEEKGLACEILYPTVIEERGGKIVGVLSTKSRGEMFVAGSFCCSSIFSGIKLGELYEKVLLDMGIKRYVFFIDKKDTKWINSIERFFGIKPFSSDEDSYWYLREVV